MIERLCLFNRETFGLDMIIHHKHSQGPENQGTQGFTIIELLVVLITIEILSAIALPSFLNQANKAKQSEARTYIGSMNRAQQAQYMEQGSFALDVDLLGLGVEIETNTYIYRISASSVAGDNIVHRAVPSDGSFSNMPDAQATVLACLDGVNAGMLGTAGESSTTFCYL